MLIRHYFYSIICVILLGCASQIISLEDHASGWIGRPLEELRNIVIRPGSYASRIGWKETIYKLENGNSVYIEPDHIDCFIFFEVNPKGIIIGYRTEGNGCK